MYDVAIIGAGPAGATLARLLGQHKSVLLIDDRSFADTSRDKCCGGLLSPDAQVWLGRHNLALPSQVLEQAQPLTVRAIDLANNLQQRYPRNYFNLNRLKFEQWLHSLLPGQVDISFNTRLTDFKKTPARIEMQLNCNGRKETVNTRLMVAADGANSSVRNRLGCAAPGTIKYLALQASYPLSSLPGNYSYEYGAIFDPQITDFYAWIIPKHNEVLLGIALPPMLDTAPIKSRWNSLAHKLNKLGYKFNHATKLKGTFILRPEASHIFLGIADIFMVGEAAGWISPSSAEGYSYAFASSQYLADAILSQPENNILKSYAQYSRKLKYNISWKQLKSIIMYTPSLRKLVMKSKLLSI